MLTKCWPNVEYFLTSCWIQLILITTQRFDTERSFIRNFHQNTVFFTIKSIFEMIRITVTTERSGVELSGIIIIKHFYLSRWNSHLLIRVSDALRYEKVNSRRNEKKRSFEGQFHDNLIKIPKFQNHKINDVFFEKNSNFFEEISKIQDLDENIKNSKITR